MGRFKSMSDVLGAIQKNDEHISRGRWAEAENAYLRTMAEAIFAAGCSRDATGIIATITPPKAEPAPAGPTCMCQMMGPEFCNATEHLAPEAIDEAPIDVANMAAWLLQHADGVEQGKSFPPRPIAAADLREAARMLLRSRPTVQTEPDEKFPATLKLSRAVREIAVCILRNGGPVHPLAAAGTLDATADLLESIARSTNPAP